MLVGDAILESMNPQTVLSIATHSSFIIGFAQNSDKKKLLYCWFGCRLITSSS